LEQKGNHQLTSKRVPATTGAILSVEVMPVRSFGGGRQTVYRGFQAKQLYHCTNLLDEIKTPIYSIFTIGLV
jgi:hypothetical protein